MSFSTYPQNSSDWNFRKWVVPMLLLSLLLHCGLMVWFQMKKLRTFVPVETERLIPRPFKLDRATIDPKVLQTPNLPEPSTVATQPIPDVAKVQITEPKKAFAEVMKEIRAAPASTDLAKPLLNEKPKIDPARVNAAMTQMQEQSSQALDREMETLRKQLIQDKPSSLNQPKLEAQGLKDSTSDLLDKPSDSPSKLKGESAGPNEGMAGFSDLDQLLTQTGPLSPGTAPIYMPSNTLFDYDSHTVRDGVITELQKLGQLIQKNPEATFVIEGHTDSYGSPGYNQQLSLARAEAVKIWLLQNMGIDPRKVQTRGFGSTRLLVPANKTVEEQQLNRRVEIVIKTK